VTCDAQRGVDGDAGSMHGEAEAVLRSKLICIDVRDCTAIGPKAVDMLNMLLPN
jgi:hypothetical protein